MTEQKFKPYKVILNILIIILLILGVTLYFIPPGVFPDPSNGFQVLNCMRLGGGFNNFVAPDQSDISQTYSDYLTWWSPGQYLVPYFFQLIGNFNVGHASAITTIICQFLGLAGFYSFFKKMEFGKFVSAISLVFIVCQQAFVVPYVFYNGGELLIFAFEGWFLYGCASLTKPGIKLLLFVLLSGWIGFFLKSSFLWMYAAGLCCLWIRLSSKQPVIEWVKKAFWIGVPAIISLVVIYISFLSKGTSPASTSKGLGLGVEIFGFPLASPILSGFSIDDLLHGMFFHVGKPVLNYPVSIVLLLLLAIASVWLIIIIVKKVPYANYRLFIAVFYITAVIFFTTVFIRHLNISFEARHFRLLGLLIVPGMIYLIGKLKPAYQWTFVLIVALIGFTSFFYVVKGFVSNKMSARGGSGLTQTSIDQPSLNAIMKLDQQNKNATFVFVSYDTGLEIIHNRSIILPPIADDLKINTEDYTYEGFAGPLYIVLPESYNGPKEKMIMKSFPGYTGFTESMLSDKYVLYSANTKR